jgi:hypothetical protein
MVQWWYAADGQRRGPISFDEMLLLWRQGQVDLDTLAWTKGMDGWQALGALPAFASLSGAVGDEGLSGLDTPKGTSTPEPRRLGSSGSLKYKIGLFAVLVIVGLISWNAYQKNRIEHDAAMRAEEAQALIIEQQKKLEEAKKTELALALERERLILAEQRAKEEAAKSAAVLKKIKEEAEILQLVDRTKYFLKDYFSTWSSSDEIALRFVNDAYAETVDFFGTKITKAEIIQQKKAFVQRWPSRSYKERGNKTAISCNAINKTCSVTGEIDWLAQSMPRDANAAGDASYELLLDLSGPKIKILRENGKTGLAANTSALIASPGNPGWQADEVTGCKAWNSSPRQNEKVRWTGSCVAGFIEGEGRLTWTWSGGSQVTSASYAKGKRTGNGLIDTITTENGVVWSYRGMQVNGKNEGQGDAKFTNGASYQGAWKQGDFHGFGSYTWTNNVRYQGGWSDGLPDSAGVMIYADGTQINSRAVKGCIWEYEGRVGRLLHNFGTTVEQCNAGKKP